jgi:arylsulfatase A-like enzyme
MPRTDLYFHRRLLHGFATLIIVAASLSPSKCPVIADDLAPKTRRPNIVFILADDLGYGDLGCYGQKQIATPRLDRMAAEGLRFTQFYAGSTVCAPSRSVLMTGLHTGHTRVRGNAAKSNPRAQMLRDEDLTVAEILKQAGYATGLVGKWGLGLAGDEGVPNRQGFDYFFGFLSQTHAHNHYPDYLWRNDEKVPLPNVVTPVGDNEGGYAVKRVQYAGDLFADEAVQFVEKHRDGPFFLYYALTMPHANNERSRELGDGQEVPDYGDYAARDWIDPHKGQAAMITRLDGYVGRLLDKLAELGIDRNTLVIFTSDNGPHKEGGRGYDPDFFDANGPVSGTKRSLTDGGIRVPMIAWWPGRVPAGKTTDHIGYFGDFFATAARVAVLPPPDGLDSVSFYPTLLYPMSPELQGQHQYLYWEFYEGNPPRQALRMKQWKAIAPIGGPIALYDVTTDIAETRDVSAEHADVVAEIRRIFAEAHVDNEHWSFKRAR